MRWLKWRAARSFKKELITCDVPKDVAKTLAEDYKATLKFRDLLRLGAVLSHREKS